MKSMLAEFPSHLFCLITPPQSAYRSSVYMSRNLSELRNKSTCVHLNWEYVNAWELNSSSACRKRVTQKLTHVTNSSMIPRKKVKSQCPREFLYLWAWLRLECACACVCVCMVCACVRIHEMCIATGGAPRTHTDEMTTRLRTLSYYYNPHACTI